MRSNELAWTPIDTLTEIKVEEAWETSTIVDDIETGPAALTSLCEDLPRVWLYLDEGSWTSSHRDQRVAVLRTIEALSRGYEIELV